MNRPMLIEQPIPVRAYEIDAMGIVSNIVYVKWFEDLRHGYLDKYYPYSRMLKEGKSPMLMKTEIEYKAPLTIHDEPVGRLWVIKFGRTKWVMQFEISTGSKVHCLGKQTGCFYDLEKEGITTVPEDLLAEYNKAI